MTAALQWGALGLLALVLIGLGTGAKLFLSPALKGLQKLVGDSLATNRALREAMVSAGQRLARLAREQRVLSNMMLDIHRETLGAKRTSDYGLELSAIRTQSLPPEDPKGEE